MNEIIVTPEVTSISASINDTKNLPVIVNDEKMLPVVPPRPAPPPKEPFSFQGFQVVRGEFFAHLFEPSVTFKGEKVAVNAACLRKLPTVEYVQFLVHPEKKMLAVKPCTEDTRDSFRWCSPAGALKKRKPKSITCKIFFAKVMELMGWNHDYRYKILGKLICTASDKIFVFDLASSEAYKRKLKDEAAPDRKPKYSADWKDQFGIPAESHDDDFDLKIFDDNTVFRIEREDKPETEEPENE